MPVEDMAAVMEDTAVGMADMLLDMPRPAMLGADPVPFVSALDVATILPEIHADSGDMQDAHMPGIAAAYGEVIMDIRTLDIPAIISGITAWATTIRTTDMAITVTVPGRAMIPITVIIRADTIPTDTDTRRI